MMEVTPEFRCEFGNSITDDDLRDSYISHNYIPKKGGYLHGHFILVVRYKPGSFGISVNYY